jgi:acetylornithine deacetylase/succinyl-diaminopimelate desuccinylase-like protein
MNLTEYIESKRDDHLNELYEFLRIPSVSAQSEHKPDIERAAKWVAEKLRAAGLDNVEILPTKMHPLVYGESLRAPGKPTILFYGHYDVQPAEPLDLWTSPAFEPAIRGGNLYARGSADDKGQVHIHIRALDAIMKTAGKLPINLKVMIEGEEEVGSVSLWEFVSANKARLKADALVVSDTGMLARGVPSITYALRGLNYYQIEITGPAQDLHSGIFGGAVPNPITILCELFAKLHDKNSRVAIPGFYDDVAKLSNAERKALKSLPWKANDFRKTVGAPGLSGEKGFSIIEQLGARPTLELNGIWGGYTGEGSKTVIPSKAYAKFSTRLVPSQNAEKITRLVERHIRKLLPKTVKFKLDVHSQGNAWAAPYTHPFFEVAHKALEKGFGKRAVFIREGGSIPFVTQMHDTFKVPCILLGFGLPDENAHAPDEHIALEHYFGGIKAVAEFYEGLGKLN